MPRERTSCPASPAGPDSTDTTANAGSPSPGIHSGIPDPVPRMLRNEVMASRYVSPHPVRSPQQQFAPSPRRSRTTQVTSARRRTIFVSSLMSTIMCTRSAIPRERPACTPAAHSATCGRSTAYARTASPRINDDDRLRFPPISPAQNGKAGKKRINGPPPQPTLPAIRQAIIERIARAPPERCPHCRKWICNENERE
jgi:hypothetical protein